MENVKAMKYREMETEVIRNRCEMRAATLDRKRELIRRNHDLMVEMDLRWMK